MLGRKVIMIEGRKLTEEEQESSKDTLDFVSNKTISMNKDYPSGRITALRFNGSLSVKEK